ncbi:valine--tRNA ligase, mitochondrial-like [Oppia nitens]|uniref:valine--tRNA ligase, mitochondrial-like n=1 Tax=Oppia nitens TaxID=1686743 RepID=UPI0023DA04F0|nr:valine--tRNA ligase, mitochondrial-like [Oppia nitens]
MFAANIGQLYAGAAAGSCGSGHQYRRLLLLWSSSSMSRMNTVAAAVAVGSGVGQQQQHRHCCRQELDDYLRSDFGRKHPQQRCEQFWSQYWQKTGLFGDTDRQHRRRRRSQKTGQTIGGGDCFKLLLPPPNITGSLHLGHALTVAIEDALCRYHRMTGHTVQWIPGLDHAGIATQIMVEKHLWTKYGKTRHDLTRDQFLGEVDQWKTQRSAEIREQLLRLGASLDYTQEYYTLSPEMSAAVTEAFVQLFNRQQIYRSTKAVNWSYYMRSTLSDIEVDVKHIDGPTELTVPGYHKPVVLGVMHRFNYPLEDNSNDVIPVATTRLETVIGDVAIAVHPDDKRYSHMIGRMVINPISGRRMPIVADQSVVQTFGTGAVKITPGHSRFDHELAERHRLPVLLVFDQTGRLDCPELPEFHGLHRFSAKDAIKSALIAKGLYLDQSDHSHSVPVCPKTGDLIEHRCVPQWFLRCQQSTVDRARLAIVEDDLNPSVHCCPTVPYLDPDKHLSLVPPNYRFVWREWFNRLEDWCISRQIYWGHQIPAYNVIIDGQLTDEWIAAKSYSEALLIAEHRHPDHTIITVRQDPDVLDTWFSSSLLPLSVNGWPTATVNGKQQLDTQSSPLSLMETGYDILFFWVARMVQLSLELTDRLPFNRVLLHAMVGDSDGKKMSKSWGNVIDPIDIIDGISLKELIRKNEKIRESGFTTTTTTDTTTTTLAKSGQHTKHKLAKQFPSGIVSCGADALRWHLLRTNYKSENVSFDLKKVVKSRNFTNKMHQTVRFLFNNLDNRFVRLDILDLTDHLSPDDRQILSQLAETVRTANQAFESYDLREGVAALEHFWHNKLCDIYLERVKHVLKNTDDDDDLRTRNTVLNVLVYTINTGLRALHPFMPFITENLWQHINHRLLTITTAADDNNHNLRQEFSSICDEDYPDITVDPVLRQYQSVVNDRDMHLVGAIIEKIRWFTKYFEITDDILSTTRISIATYDKHLQNYRQLIQSAIGNDVDSVDMVSIHDIHRYYRSFCFKVCRNEVIADTDGGNIDGNNVDNDVDDDEDDDTNEYNILDIDKNNRNHFNDCYVLFSFSDEVMSKLSNELIADVSGVAVDDDGNGNDGIEAIDGQKRKEMFDMPTLIRFVNLLFKHRNSRFHQNYWKTKSMRESD